MDSTEINNLREAFWAGDMGEVEFTECALESGMSLEDIGAFLQEVREEDGSF